METKPLKDWSKFNWITKTEILTLIPLSVLRTTLTLGSSEGFSSLSHSWTVRGNGILVSLNTESGCKTSKTNHNMNSICTRVGLITHRKLSKQCCFVLQQVRGRGNLNKHSNLVCFPKVRTGRPDHGWTCHFENEIGFFQEFLMKNDFLRVYY